MIKFVKFAIHNLEDIPKGQREMTKVSMKFDKGLPIEVEYDFGKDLDEMCELFGDVVVYSNAKANMHVGVQGVGRSVIKAGKTAGKPVTQKQVQEAVSKHKPGIRKRGKSPAEKLKENYDKLTPEAKKELLAELTKTS